MSILVEVAKANDSYRLSLRGHAEYNPGNDIVCAGVSAIAYALAGYIINAPGHVREMIALSLESGEAEISVRGDERIAAAIDMALIGILQISAKYPQKVQVKGWKKY